VPTQLEAINAARTQIDDENTASQFFTDQQIQRWINDGVRDVARRTESVLSYYTALTATAGQGKYNLPTNVIRVHRCEFTPTGSTQIYNIQPSTYDELDQIWGINPTIQASYPSAFACWGTVGQMTIQFYPVPGQSGRFNLFYYKMPTDLTQTGATTDNAVPLDIPAGWDDVITEYVTFRALMKIRDPTWQMHRQLYDTNIQYLIEVTRQAHDGGRYVQTATSSVPQWLYQFEY
jgi:hypothetical protein